MKPLIALALPLLLSACAVTPMQPLPSTHPASALAPEAPVSSSVNLSPDEETRTTQQLLSESQAAQPQDTGMSAMPGMNH